MIFNEGVIPKTTSIDHLNENINIFDFNIEDSDLTLINNLNNNEHFCWNSDKIS
jgi:diketogulonate reductase-like aldo/keto reductase